MAEDLGVEYRVKIITDASAAKGISMRRGLGQVRHIEVNQLWIQDRVRRGDIELEKIGGKLNISDALTKAADGESVGMHCEGTETIFKQGRHELAPAVADTEVLGRFTETSKEE